MEGSRKRSRSDNLEPPKKSKKESSPVPDDHVSEEEDSDSEPELESESSMVTERQSSLSPLKIPDTTGIHSIKRKFLNAIESLHERMEDDSDERFDVEDIAEFRALFDELEEEEPNEKRVLIDNFLRDYLLERTLGDEDNWFIFLELSLILAREEIASASVPISLVTDLVELSNLETCEEIFVFVEDHLSTWREPLFLNAGKNAVLRMCNDLLRRLSRAQNTVFCGRILIFLSNYFPFSERSGLNIMSEFNVENLTVYKTGDGSDDPDDKMEVNVETEEQLFEGMDLQIPGLEQMVSICQEEKKKGMVVDYNLYVKFWSLQDFFRNPLQCYNKIAWKTFTSYTGDVLGAFQCFKIEELPTTGIKRGKEENDLSSSINLIPKLGDQDLYFAKYLTNRRLLELQMGDPNFRRYFMVQLLIIIQYLTLTVKFKGESHVLNEEQLEYIRKNTEKIYELLADIPPDGKEFVSAVRHVLKREELWNKWKNDGCPIFKKPSVAQAISSDSKDEKDDKLDGDEEKDKAAGKGSSSTGNALPPAKGGAIMKTENVALVTGADDMSPEIEETTKQKPKKKRRHLGDLIRDATLNNKFLLGNSELTKLWNICPNNLEACRAKARDFMPPIETFFAEAMKELEPDTVGSNETKETKEAKKDVKPKKILGNPNFGWKALRLLARRSPYFFSLVSGTPIHPLQNYLEHVLKKIAADSDIPILSTDGSKIEAKEPTATGTTGDMEGEMEAGADDDEELIKPETRADEDMRDEEEGEVRNEKLRNLTLDETVALGKALGDDWKKLGLKLGFKNDEIEYFEVERKDKAGEYMLKMWTEQEGEDATVADLLYRLEGLGLLAKVETIIS